MKHFFRELWYSFKRDILPYPLGFIGKYGIKLILRSCKVEVYGLDHLEKMGKQKCVMIFWHNRMTVMCEFFHRYFPDRDYAVLLSKSRDGEPIAHVIRKYARGSCIRVAHNARHQALREAIDYLNETQGVLLVTPDGPKGPCYKMKPGALLAAKKANAPIVTFSWEANRYWELKSWDKLRFPKPFSTIKMTLSEPVHLDSSLNTEVSIAQLERKLTGNI